MQTHTLNDLTDNYIVMTILNIILGNHLSEFEF